MVEFSNETDVLDVNIALKMEAASTSKMLINFYRTTWRYNPEDSHLHEINGFLYTDFSIDCSFRDIDNPVLLTNLSDYTCKLPA
jgi:hypothetical protein